MSNCGCPLPPPQSAEIGAVRADGNQHVWYEQGIPGSQNSGLVGDELFVGDGDEEPGVARDVPGTTLVTWYFTGDVRSRR